MSEATRRATARPYPADGNADTQWDALLAVEKLIKAHPPFAAGYLIRMARGGTP